MGVKLHNHIILVALMLAFLPLSAFAQQGNSRLPSLVKTTKRHEYAPGNLSNISKLYWGIGLHDLKEDVLVDNYMRINECDIYINYFSDEFEWFDIRKKTRDYLKKNMVDFPLRLSFAQPINIGRYVPEEKGFEVVEKSNISRLSKFEVFASDYGQDVCETNYKESIQGYPKGLSIELSRPVFLDVVPMEPKIAERYIEERIIEYRKIDKKYRSGYDVSDLREVYMVMNVKFVASAGTVISQNDAQPMVKMLGILEGVEVYDDPNLQRLIFSESYDRQRKKRTQKQIGGGLERYLDNEET